MPLATGHYWPNFLVGSEGVVGTSEVDCCMVSCVCRCLDNHIAVCDPSSMEIAQRAKKNGHNGHEKNAKRRRSIQTMMMMHLFPHLPRVPVHPMSQPKVKFKAHQHSVKSY